MANGRKVGETLWQWPWLTTTAWIYGLCGFAFCFNVYFWDFYRSFGAWQVWGIGIEIIVVWATLITTIKWKFHQATSFTLLLMLAANITAFVLYIIPAADCANEFICAADALCDGTIPPGTAKASAHYVVGAIFFSLCMVMNAIMIWAAWRYRQALQQGFFDPINKPEKKRSWHWQYLDWAHWAYAAVAIAFSVNLFTWDFHRNFGLYCWSIGLSVITMWMTFLPTLLWRFKHYSAIVAVVMSLANIAPLVFYVIPWANCGQHVECAADALCDGTGMSGTAKASDHYVIGFICLVILAILKGVITLLIWRYRSDNKKPMFEEVPETEMEQVDV